MFFLLQAFMVAGLHRSGKTSTIGRDRKYMEPEG